MVKVASMLAERLKAKTEAKPSKMRDLAERSHEGRLSSFTQVFKQSELSQDEKEQLKELLARYKADETSVTEDELARDFHSLAMITSEVKAINNQAILLHGERIKRAQIILKGYREGAFTSWLITTYGNRQTPYNFLQYFEFHKQIPAELSSKVDAMPKQAIYTLASREGALEEKVRLIENYDGSSKKQILETIRDTFPVAEEDGRRTSAHQTVLTLTKRLAQAIKKGRLNEAQKASVREALTELLSSI